MRVFRHAAHERVHLAPYEQIRAEHDTRRTFFTGADATLRPESDDVFTMSTFGSSRADIMIIIVNVHHYRRNIVDGAY